MIYDTLYIMNGPTNIEKKKTIRGHLIDFCIISYASKNKIFANQKTSFIAIECELI